MLETIRVQERRVKGKKSREKVERRELLETGSPREKSKGKKKQRKNREERVAGGTKVVRKCKKME